ncbi:hypothetical protein lerEdw1_002654 [Lerista edwardsae]|nr:hypothetical protein lerEdw1_002654 [Lerista edwardsae]
MLAGLALLLGLYVLIYYNFAKGTRCKNETSLRGKTVLITGANKGIGKATALDLARRGARVILACRSKVQGECAAYDIRRESGNNEVLFMSLDLADLNSVHRFADAFLRSEPRLDILINNAGPSKDGFNLTFQVNHLSHFLLTHLLLDQLKRCAPSRVLVVASKAHLSGKIDIQNIHKPVDSFLQAFLSYCHSKLANILTVRELANRLKGTNVTCYAIDPGFVRSDVLQAFPIWLKPLVFLITWLFFQDPIDGAQTSSYCATQEGIEMFSGRYFANCGLHEPWPHARDDAVAKKLWEVSERMLGLPAS